MLQLRPVILITIILVLASYALGVWGYFLLDEGYTVSDCFYQSLRLYSINAPAKNPDLPIQLELARFMAAAAVFLGILATLFHIFREWAQSFFLQFMRNHVLIAGVNPSALALAKDALSLKKKKVVILCDDREDSHLQPLRESGAICIEGNPADENYLSRAGIKRASHFLAFTDDDALNVELTLCAEKSVQNRDERVHKELQCHVLFQRRTFLKSFREHSLLTNSLNNMDVSLFHSGDLGARLALQQYPLEVNQAGEIAEDIHLVIFMPSSEGFSLLRHALQVGHYTCSSPLQITLVGTKNLHMESHLNDHFPNWQKIAEIKLITAQDPSPTQLIATFLETRPSLDTWHTLVCASQHDEENLALSQQLRLPVHQLPCRILCFLSENEGLSSLLKSTSPKKGDSLAEVGVVAMGASLATWDQVVQPILDDQAKLVHSLYLKNEKAAEKWKPDNPAHWLWQNLGEVYKGQNRLQADHIPIKLRAAGIDTTNLPSHKKLEKTLSENLETLSEMEHARWNACSFLAGWKHAAGDKNDILKTSPYLIPWAELSDEVQEYDRDTVRNIPKLLTPDRRLD